MAQVTMNGTEYANFIHMESRYEELITLIKDEHLVRFPTEESVGSWQCGDFPVRTARVACPKWLQDEILVNMARHLLSLDCEEFIRWVSADKHYYDIKDQRFTEWNSSPDLLQVSPELRARWEATKNGIEGV